MVLKEIPWYQEIIRRGEQRERVRMLLYILQERVTTTPSDLPGYLAGLDMPTLDGLRDVAMTVSSLDAFSQAVVQHTAPEQADKDHSAGFRRMLLSFRIAH